jgi:N-methylhydantoinase A
MEIHVGIDVGGTFTDVAVSLPGENRLIRYKLPSTPERPDQAIVTGLAAVLEANDLPPAGVVRLSHGTTVGTNALIQGRCGTVAVVTTDGFRDLLEVRRQTRPKVYDVHLDHPPPLVPRERRHEVVERMRADGAVHRPLDEDGVRHVGERLAGERVDCVVVCFVHSYAYPDHEARAVEILREVLPPGTHVLASTSVYPEFREYERFSTAVLNGALLTVMAEYLDRFTAEVAELGVAAQPNISQSAGGLMSVGMARRLPVRATLSGPAAGVLGTAYRIARTGHRDVITLDVGGTSADVSLLAGGVPAELGEQALAGFPLRLPALDVNTVGAGGGSIAWVDVDDLLKVGPQSAGADPGPACYGLGGDDATVTDANVVLGRLDGEALLDGRMPIDRSRAAHAIERLADRIGLDLTETALGIVRVACAIVVAAIRKISVERGHDPGAFALFAFGGAGPLLGGDVARGLGIRTVLVPASPGILCAEGLLNCDLRADLVRTSLMTLDDAAPAALNAVRGLLAEDAERWFADERLGPGRRRLDWAVDLRYRGQNFELVLPVDDRPFTKARCRRLMKSFHAAHARAYGFASPEEPIEFVSMKARASGLLDSPVLPTLERSRSGPAVGSRRVVFDAGRWHEAALYRRESLAPGQAIEGPAVIEQLDTTTLLYPGDACVVDDWGNLEISLAGGEQR